MEKLGIIGSGTMGHSIALSVAWSGLPVMLYGINSGETEKAKTAIWNKLQVLHTYGLFEHDAINGIINRISITHSIDEVAAASTFIIEAVPEDINIKNELFISLDKACKPDVILATNTSGLSPTAIAKGVLHPERTIALHFWNPAHLIPLVEVVRGEKTNDQTVKRAFELLLNMKKKPVEVRKEIPGFIGNRLQFALFREAQHLLEQGIATREDIDAAVTYGIGRRLPVTGPLVSADMGGLDVFSAIADYLFNDLSNLDSSPPALKKMVQDKKLGAKTGEGYYRWDPLFLERMNKNREAELIRFLKQDLEDD